MNTKVDVAAVMPASAWTNCVYDALHEVFSMMLGIKVTPCADTKLVPELTAIIGLAGSLCGLLSIRCSRKTGIMLTQRMLSSSDVNHGEEQVLDALGELCNMLAGSFKARLPGIANTCMLSIPTTITGADYQVHPVHGGQRFEMLAHCNGESLQVILHVNF